MNRSSPIKSASLATSSPRSFIGIGNSPRDSVTSTAGTAGRLPPKAWDALDQRSPVNRDGVSPSRASLPLDATLPDVSRVPAPAPPGPYGQYQHTDAHLQRTHLQRRMEPPSVGDAYSPRFVERGGSGGISGSMVPEQWGHVKLTSADGYFSYAGGLTPTRRPFTAMSVGVIPAAAHDARFGDGRMLGPPDGVEVGDLPYSALSLPDVRQNLAEKSTLLDRAAARQSERDEQQREIEYRTQPVWLKVVVVSAHGLRVADEDTGSSDPYCICEVPGKREMKFRTPVVDQTLDPVWKHAHDFPVFLQTDSLRFSVYDQDPEWSELLGRAKLEAADLFPKGFSGELRLTEAGTEDATLLVQVHVLRNEDAKKAELQAQQEREEAAMKIQASMRGKQERDEAAAAEKEELEREMQRARELKAKEDSEERRRRERYEQKRKDREVAEQRLRKIKQMQKETSAIAIQSWWRGMKFRRIVEHHIRLKKFEREKARRKRELEELERRVREENLEKQRRKQRLEDKIRRVEAQWPTRAALRIQSWWRRLLLRRTVEYRIRQKDEAKQRHIERELLEERERFELEREQAKNAQAQRRQREHEAAQAKLREMEEKRKVVAAVKLQSWRRGQLARRDYDTHVQGVREAEQERRLVREKERLAEQERIAEARRIDEENRKRESLKRAQQQKDAAMMKLLQLEMKQQQKAVLMVQAARRGQLARRRREDLLKQKQAQARQKQKETTAKKAQDFEHRKREEAAAKIHRLVLGFAARCKVKALRRKKAAEQAAEVAHKEKMAAARRARDFKAKQRSDAATKVQALWRGRQQKQQYQQDMRRRKEEIELERKRKERDAAKRKYHELEKKRQQDAATRIQSAFRGKKARRSFSEQIATKAQLEEARKKEVRLAKEAEAKAKRDASIKEKLAAIEQERRENAAIAVQRLVRGGIARKRYHQTKKDVQDRERARRMKLQKEQEAKENVEKEEARRREREAAQQKLEELEMMKMNKAATKLQRMARGFLARRDYQANMEQEKQKQEREKQRRAAEKECLRLEKLAADRQRAREAAEQKLLEMEAKSRSEAATKIQAGFRGRAARRELEAKRQQIAEVDRARELERQAMKEYERRRSLERRQEEQARKREELARERLQARQKAEKQLEEMQKKRDSTAATKIQANVRRFLARRSYVRKKQRKDEEEQLRRTKQAASKKEKEREAVQKKLQELEDRRRHQAATKIQAARRGQIARNGMGELKSKKASNEREQRLNRQRERTRQIEEAEQKERKALEKKLDALDAAKRKRRAVENAHDDEAATKIQAVWRGRQARQDVKRNKRKAWNDAYADMYQDPQYESFELKLEKKRLEIEERLRTKAEERRYAEFVRRQEMLAARLLQVREAAETKRQELEEMEREAAATKIQAFRRGRAARRQYEGEMARRKEERQLLYDDSRRRAEDKRTWDLEYMRQEEAAVAIQCAFRGYRDRKRVAEMRRKLWEEAQEELYRVGSEYVAMLSEEDQTLHDAACKIQRWWRRVIRRRIRAAMIEEHTSDDDIASHAEDSLHEDEILVTLDKSSGDLWGLDVDICDDSQYLPYLRVLAINGGLAAHWNLQNPERKIAIGDEIIQVNGVRGGRRSLLREVQQAPVLKMILRCGNEAGGMSEEQAALVLQSAWRGWKTRKNLEVEQRGSQELPSDTDRAQLQAATTKIQSMWRGLLGRQIAAAKKRRKDLGYRLRRPVGSRFRSLDASALSSSRLSRMQGDTQKTDTREIGEAPTRPRESHRGHPSADEPEELPTIKEDEKSDSPEMGAPPSLHPPLGWRPVPPTSGKQKMDETRYESAWRRSIERRAMEDSGFPSHAHAEDDDEQQVAFTAHHQLSTMILRKKKEMQAEQQMLRKCKAEEARLRFLVSLSQDGQRCSRCDVKVANLAAILAALRRLTELLSLSTGRRTGAVVEGLAKVLDSVAHTHPHLAEMAAYVEDSLLNSRGDGRRTYM